MDENNITPSDENTSDTFEKVNEEPSKPKSAFEMPSESKTAAGNIYYSAPEPTPENELEKEPTRISENSFSTTTSYTADSVYSSKPETIYSSSAEPGADFSTGFAVASLILGILSILLSCCCIGGLFGILGIVFGCLQPKDEFDKKPGMAIAGITTSIIGILFSIITLVYYIGMSYLGNYLNTIR